MHYKLLHPLTCSPETADAELGRLITHAQRVWVHHLHAGQPHLAQPTAVTVLEAPDGFHGIMERKVLPIMVGKDGYEEIQPLRRRPEWTRRALLWPTPQAKPLDHATLAGWSSAMLSLCWRPGRCAGNIWHTEADLDRLGDLRNHGWTIIRIPNLATQVIPRTLWANPYAQRPLLPFPPPAAPTPPPTPATSTIPLPALAPTGEVRQLSEIVADQNDDWGLPVGSMLTGDPVRLRWLSQTLAIAADPEHEAQAVSAILGHALNTGMAAATILPRVHDPATVFHTHSDRLLVIDPQDHWQSAALPWHKLSRAELAAACGVNTGRLPESIPTEFGALLETLSPTAPRPASFLSATVSPGDDVLGVLRAGGAVILRVDGDEVSTQLSTMLLLLATKVEETPMVVIRPASITLPAELAETVIEVVLADADQQEIAAHALLTHDDQMGHWTLSFADGATPITLQADLTNVAPPLCDDERTLLVTTLQGPPDPRPLPQARVAEPAAATDDLSPAVLSLAADEVQAEPGPLPAMEPRDVIHDDDDLAPLPEIEEPSQTTHERSCRRVAMPLLRTMLKHRRATATTPAPTDEVAPDAPLPTLDEPLPLPIMDEALPLPLPVLGEADAPLPLPLAALDDQATADLPLPQLDAKVLPQLDAEPVLDVLPLLDELFGGSDQADVLPILADDDDPDLPPMDANLPTPLPALYALQDGELWPNPDDLAPVDDQEGSQPDAVDRAPTPTSLAWTLPVRQESPAVWPLSIPFDVED